MKQKKSFFTVGIFIIVFISSNFNGFSQDQPATKMQSIIENLGVGVEYVKNSELNIVGQYNWKNFAVVGQVRKCTHDKKLYFSPGIKYYINKNFYGIIPFINFRYGKLHYDQKWSRSGYDYTIEYVWDAAMGQMVPIVRPTSSSQSGSSLINSPALSISSGGEYNISNFGINATLGMSHYTKIGGDFKHKNKFFFTIGALYYFGEK
ncbi:MAG: hypothetical protein HQ541_03895 [Mariniphaga sp.]|nr:hypothetical protein [Mariniphaga sp.]